MFKIETHNNVAKLLFGRIVTSLLITYLVELLNTSFFPFSKSSAFELISNYICL